ncbi:intermediate filament protein ON3 [Pangasianodon hypophthalmus]|uniref:intermediate filament protein ON3 n=1 Tax=Pangasianodon hypophthalmus TaxID=310915 RepID=UPI002307F138|nr:intermediate filament protein ON3 [Pangasianodon hypophthalmus]
MRMPFYFTPANPHTPTKHTPSCRLISPPSTIKQVLHQPPHHLHLSAAMSSRKHISTTSKVQNFSSHSLGSHAGSERTIPRLGNSYFGFGNQPALGSSFNAVVADSSLLEPLKLDLDPNIRAIKVQEKEQIKTLNDRFASFIDKVRHLEQQNKMLETKLQLLQSSPQTKSNMESMFKMYISTLESQLNTFKNNKEHLKAELQNVHSLMEDNKYKYEEEINKRYTAENDFVCLKKDVDAGYLGRLKLEEELSKVLQDLDFFKALYAEEVQELKEQLKDTSVVVEMDNSRQLNMEQVVKDVKSQYEEVSARSRQEAEAWYKKKFELASSQVEQHSSQLKSAKSEIAELKRLITRLQADLMAVKAERKSVDEQIVETERCGEEAVFDAKQQLKELEEALQKAKQDMARQVREYQELMNIKLGLDIEISTYKKLLEGEENRIGLESVIRVQPVPKTSHTKSLKTITCTNVLVKMIETQDNSFISAKD